MKKLISVLLCVCMLSFCLYAGAYAVPIAAGDDALRAEFQGGSGGGLDYRYFAPPAEEGKRYPLVVWLHGIGSGNYAGDQIDSYDVCKWDCDEFQARFADAGGAYLFAPRCAGGWDLTTPAALKACIDSFISGHAGSVDTNRIYLTGFSVGATMVLKTASAYPNFFAAAVPISAVVQDASQVKALSGMAVWFFANEQDTYVSANVAATRSSFNTLSSVAADKSKVRFTAVSKAVTPSGATVGTQHYMWRIFTNDMFMADGSQYAYSTTVDGTGATISFSSPNGIISWLSQQSKQTQPTSAPGKSFLEKIADFFRMIINFFANLFS
ncbi:MAG: hypothetical protein IJK89_12485 [Clostridia bacterium]|nr:hypothetical protein [Clostridia bacterium]